MVRAPDCGSGGRRFKSGLPPHPSLERSREPKASAVSSAERMPRRGSKRSRVTTVPEARATARRAPRNQSDLPFLIKLIYLRFLSLLGRLESIKFFYVYILQSRKLSQRFYSGFTENLNKRLAHHNDGCCEFTRPFRPWKIKTAVAFSDRNQALEFERYLKTGAGRAFARKRL